MEHQQSSHFDFSVKRLFRAGLGVFLLLSAVFIPLSQAWAANEDELEDDIQDVEKDLKAAEAKKATLQQNLNRLDSSLRSTQAAIARTQEAIRNTTDALEKKVLEIQLLEQEIEYKKTVLRGLLQEMYFNGDRPLVQVVLAEASFSAVLDRASQTLTFQERLQRTLDEVQELEIAAEVERANLAEAKAENEQFLANKKAEQNTLSTTKADVAEDIESQEKVISRLRKELSELQSDLAALTGKSYNAKDIEEAVEFASKKTGVPKGFLFGVLKMETNLGRNVGGCTYAEVEKGAEANYKKGKLSKRSWQTFQYRRDLFKKITKELDLDYRKQKVSCNPKGYTGTGGAMGVAQFMPDTWMGYKSAVTKATGHNPPSPWNLTDGVMAMALKLDKVPGVDQGKRSAWKTAAAAYLGTSYAPYINGILYWADNYKKLI